MQNSKVSSQKTTRMTRQRSLILSELVKVKSHPTAEELYSLVKKVMPRISLGTVYRNLEFLVESGTIRKLDSAGTVRRFDGDMSDHSHARCLSCGKVVDIFQNPIQNLALENIAIENFSLTSVSLEFEGICADCSKNQTIIQEPSKINQ